VTERIIATNTIYDNTYLQEIVQLNIYKGDMSMQLMIKRSVLVSGALLLMSLFYVVQPGQAFTHPGLFNNAGDLNRDKAGIAAGTEPWRSAWERLQNSKLPGVSGTYAPSPQTAVVDNGGGDIPPRTDSEAAYVNAIEYWMTGNAKYATTCENILNAWSSTCTSMSGSGIELTASINFIDMVNAAEIIRYSGAGWSSADITQFQNFLANVMYPAISASNYDSWGGVCNTMMMAIGVFNNNQTIYNVGYNNFTGSNSAVACFTGLYDTNTSSYGQEVDAWRDQGHTHLGLKLGVEAAEIALNSSGQNLFTFHSNLLLAACEYVAKYNIGHGVTWDNTFGTTPVAISSASRGKFWPLYAMAHSGFQRSGLSDPYTTAVVNAEGIESLIDQGGGLGTLLYTQASTARPTPTYAMLVAYTPTGYVMAGNSGANAVTASSPCIRNLETFQEVIQGNGYSAFKSMANSLYLATNGTTALTANSSAVFGDDQEFRVVDMGNMNYQLVSDVNGQTIAVQSNGTLVPDTAGSNNTFSIYSVAAIPGVVTGLNGNTYKIINLNSGYAVDVSGASTSNGAVVDQWAYSAGNNQKWTFTNTANGFYTVKNVNSGLMLDVVGASSSAGALIDQWSSSGGLNQSWVPQYVNYADGSGSYNLYSANTPINANVLEVPGSSTSQGTQLDQWTLNGGANQQWNISAP